MPPLWITYAWADNTGKDFDYLTQQLAAAGVEVLYDRVALIPGQHLWAQLGDRICSGELAGWAYLLTPASLASMPCQEELTYALQRAIETKEEAFPLIGLLHNVSIRDVPPALRTRLCVNLASPDWIEEIRAALEQRPPARNTPTQTNLIILQHYDYLGNAGMKAIEVRPRFGDLRYWRFAFPMSGPQPVRFGYGPANGCGTASTMSTVITGETMSENRIPMKVYGAGDAISASTSAYAIFSGETPTSFIFGTAREGFGLLDQVHAEFTNSIV
jgi:hypothetical protein